jgi:flagellar hook-associated protein 2
MATITSLGAGSGLDLTTMVEQLIAAERAPKEALLDLREAGLQAKISAYGTFKSGLSAFEDAFFSLQSVAAFRQITATSSNSDIFTAAASGDAAPEATLLRLPILPSPIGSRLTHLQLRQIP